MAIKRSGRVGLGVLLIVVAVLAYSWRQHTLLDGRYRIHGNASPLLVEARGAGKKWHFSYAGADGIPGNGDDPVSTTELRLPELADVVIRLRSQDFIYVFSCPELSLKEIAVPDLDFSIGFRTGHAGRYQLAMDPMCGFPAALGETMGTLHIVSETDFLSWLGSCLVRSP